MEKKQWQLFMGIHEGKVFIQVVSRHGAKIYHIFEGEIDKNATASQIMDKLMEIAQKKTTWPTRATTLIIVPSFLIHAMDIGWWKAKKNLLNVKSWLILNQLYLKQYYLFSQYLKINGN